MTSTDTSRDPLVGRTISGLTFIEKVTAEANWLIYRAKDTASEGRLVEVAILAGPPFEDERKRSLFLKVGRTLASLDQENVVRVLKVIESPTAAYVVMEHFEGRTLATILKRERTLRADRAAHVIAQVAKGLAAAHGWKLLHRSVCPAHVIVADDDTAKLGGFTLVPPDPGQPPGADALPYLAPERFSGGKPSTSADVFALGATFYHALTGKQPYPGETVAELAAAHAGEAPAPPRDVKANIPEEVDVLARAMIAPAKGYRLTMPQLIEKIDELVASGAAKPGSRPGGRPRASALRPARKKSMVGPIVAVVILLIGAAILALKFGGAADETSSNDGNAKPNRETVTDVPDEPKPPTPEELAIEQLAEADEYAVKYPEPKDARKVAVQYDGVARIAPTTSAGREAKMKARKFNQIADEYDKSGVKEEPTTEELFDEHFANARAAIAGLKLDEAHELLTKANDSTSSGQRLADVRLEVEAVAHLVQFRDKLIAVVPEAKTTLDRVIKGASETDVITSADEDGITIDGGGTARKMPWTMLGPLGIWKLTQRVASTDEGAMFGAWLYLATVDEDLAAEASGTRSLVKGSVSPYDALEEKFGERRK